jgi:hypothetical protein
MRSLKIIDLDKLNKYSWVLAMTIYRDGLYGRVLSFMEEQSGCISSKEYKVCRADVLRLT